MGRDRRRKTLGKQHWKVWDKASGGCKYSSRAESTGGCILSKTVTEIRWSKVPDTFGAESVYFVLNSLWDWEPVERFKQRNGVVSLTCVFLSVGGEQHSSNLLAGTIQKSMDLPCAASEIHKIPIERMEEDSDDYPKIWRKMLQLVSAGVKDGQYPPLYCLVGVSAVLSAAW